MILKYGLYLLQRANFPPMNIYNVCDKVNIIYLHSTCLQREDKRIDRRDRDRTSTYFKHNCRIVVFFKHIKISSPTGFGLILLNS